MFSNSFSVIRSAKGEEIIEENLDISNKIDLDYLKKFPQSSYIIESGDTLRIIVSRDYPELTTEVTIDGEGSISLPIIKKVYVSGLTITELNMLLTKAYKTYVKYPELDAQILDYRPIKILINGEVNQPGLYTLKGSQKGESFEDQRFNKNADSKFDFERNFPTGDYFSTMPKLQPQKVSYYFPTVFDAIRASGGVTQYSDLSNIQLIRKDTLTNGGGKKMTSLNFSEAVKNGDDSQNIRIYDGDVINIKKLDKPNSKLLGYAIRSNLNPKFIRILVTGRVNNPGQKILGKSSTLNDAIDVSGGSKFLRGPVRYISFNNDGSVEKRRISYRKNNDRGSYQNPYLKDGDLVIIGNSLLSNSTEFIKEITSPFIGLYSAYSFFD